MTTDIRRRGLGRGLNALFASEEAVYKPAETAANGAAIAAAEPATAPGAKRIPMAPIERLHPGKGQPRDRFDEESLEQLAASIRTKGILQPILVRPDPRIEGAYEIIAGERRWRAAQRAKLHEVPVIVQELTDAEALEIGLIENLQRENLNPIEEARGYQRLIADYSHSQADLGEIIGKSRAHIANMMRLLTLPQRVQAYLADGRLTAGHARALVGRENAGQLADRIIAEGLNVRQVEALAGGDGKARGRGGKAKKDSDTLALEKELAELLGLDVAIEVRGKGGRIAIRYGSLEQLDDLLRRLTGRKRAGA